MSCFFRPADQNPKISLYNHRKQNKSSVEKLVCVIDYENSRPFIVCWLTNRFSATISTKAYLFIFMCCQQCDSSSSKSLFYMKNDHFLNDWGLADQVSPVSFISTFSAHISVFILVGRNDIKTVFTRYFLLLNLKSFPKKSAHKIVLPISRRNRLIRK